jgi:hypothetical protein
VVIKTPGVDGLNVQLAHRNVDFGPDGYGYNKQRSRRVLSEARAQASGDCWYRPLAAKHLNAQPLCKGSCWWLR